MKLENWSLTYAILKPFVKMVHRLMYKNMVIVGKENIKGNKPLVLAPNHQNALLDSLMVLFASPFQPVWLARADIFSSKWARMALRVAKMTPVYRIRDGKESLGKNKAVFEQAVRVLQNNKQLALFAEATHSGRRQALPHKKAVPRIVFTAAEMTNFELDVQIIPVGIYYSHYYHFDRDALIEYGEPIPLQKFKTFYQENPNEATLQLKKELNEKVLALSLNIPSKTFYKEYEFLREVIGYYIRCQNHKGKLDLRESLKSDQHIVDVIYQNETDDSEDFHRLISHIKSYHSVLQKLKISDKAMASKTISSMSTLLRTIDLIFKAPFALLGYFTHYLLYSFPLKKIKKTVKDDAFWGSVLFVISFAGGIVLYSVYAVLVACFTSSAWLTMAVLLFLPITAKIAWRTSRAWELLKMRLKIKKGLKSKDEQILEATALRSEILKIYDAMNAQITVVITQ